MKLVMTESEIYPIQTFFWIVTQKKTTFATCDNVLD